MKSIVRLVILILVIGFAVGAWQLLKKNGSVPAIPGVTATSPAKTRPMSPGASRTAITLVTSATKKGWLESQVERFNAEKGGNVQIKYIETRDALQAIINQKEQPVLWSPSAPVWATGLSQGWAKKYGGEPLINDSDPNTYRVYLRTPIVFVTTRQKAGFLRPLLAGNDAWNELVVLSAGKKKLPGSTRPFRWAHADPIKSNSGFLTLGLLLDAYVQSKDGAVTPEQAATSTGFSTFMNKVEATMPLDAAVREGSSALLKSFLADTDRYDLITAYESSALEAAAKNTNVSVLYPNPTMVSEQVVVVLNGDWVTADQKDQAAELLTFLGSEDSLRDGLNNHFRPVRQTGSITLAPEINRRRAAGFQQTFTSVEVPSYDALNNAADRWNQTIGTR